MKLPEINTLLKSLDRELWIVTAASQGALGGLVASFVSSISIVPELPRMAVAIAKQHRTGQLIEACRCFAVHLLAADQSDSAWHFGSQSGHDVDKFDQVQWVPGVTGSPILSACFGWLECRVEASMDTGDRILYVAEVVAGDLTRSFQPLTQRQFLGQASPEQLAVLKANMSADSQRDAAAIEQWRILRQPQS